MCHPRRGSVTDNTLSMISVRGDPFITFAPRGGGGLVKTNDSTDRLREWDSNEGGRGSKNPKILQT